MKRPKKEKYIFYQGEKFQVEFYFTETGGMPAKEYLEKESLGVQVKLAALVKYIADHGRLFNKTKFRKVDSKDNIFEFKPMDHRFFSFFCKGEKIIITNAYMKKTYAARLKGGNYYEED